MLERAEVRGRSRLFSLLIIHARPEGAGLACNPSPFQVEVGETHCLLGLAPEFQDNQGYLKFCLKM